MKRVNLNVSLLLNDDVAEKVEHQEDIESELALYFNIKYNGGVVFSLDKLEEIVYSIIEGYEDDEDDEPPNETTLTDKDFESIKGIVAQAIASSISNNIQIPAISINDSVVEDQYVEETPQSEVIEFNSVEMVSGEYDESDDGEDSDLSGLADMFGF